jgi:NAD(P) transhydrogenase subunit alpha
LKQTQAAQAIAAKARRNTQLLVAGGLAGVLLLFGLTIASSSMFFNITIFIFATVIGIYVISNITSALHTPLMSQTNAISGVILIGSLLMLGHSNWLITVIAFISGAIAAINVFGGFFVTRRMIAMFHNN